MPTMSHTEHVDVDIGNRIEDMINDLGQKCFWQAHTPFYEKLQSDSKKALYLGCTS